VRDRKHPANTRRLIGVNQIPVIATVTQYGTTDENRTPNGSSFQCIDIGRESL